MSFQLFCFSTAFVVPAQWSTFRPKIGHTPIPLQGKKEGKITQTVLKQWKVENAKRNSISVISCCNSIATQVELRFSFPFFHAPSLPLPHDVENKILLLCLFLCHVCLQRHSHFCIGRNIHRACFELDLLIQQ